MSAERFQRLEEMAANLFSADSQAPEITEPSQPSSVDREVSCEDNSSAKPEFRAGAPKAEDEGGTETTMTDQPDSPLVGLDLDTAIHLRWVLRDIKAKRTKLSPVGPDDLRTLIEMGLVEMRDEVPVLTNEGHRVLD
jgi:hypothetical protein